MSFSRSGKSNYYKYNKYSYNGYDQNYRYKRDYKFYNRRPKKAPSRPPSPVLGSQEYMDKKIEQTSAIIMRQLLNPNETPLVETVIERESVELVVTTNQDKVAEAPIDSQTACNSSTKNKKKLTSQEVEEIHTKIMCHLSNLNDGRKKNLINSKNSGYDATIQHFVKQQRLEISRALRKMCSANLMEKPSEIISSIIPDIGIKIEDLPRDVIEELSHTFGCDFNAETGFSGYEHFSTDTGNSMNYLNFVFVEFVVLFKKTYF